MSRDQIGLLNATIRDVQLGAILDQFTGRKAKKVIAKRRVEFVFGNGNRFARILNEPAQLKKIKTYNQLSVSITQLQRERDVQKLASKAQKKKIHLEKEFKKMEKERDAAELRERFLPTFTAAHADRKSVV